MRLRAGPGPPEAGRQPRGGARDGARESPRCSGTARTASGRARVRHAGDTFCAHGHAMRACTWTMTRGTRAETICTPYVPRAQHMQLLVGVQRVHQGVQCCADKTGADKQRLVKQTSHAARMCCCCRTASAAHAGRKQGEDEGAWRPTCSCRHECGGTPTSVHEPSVPRALATQGTLHVPARSSDQPPPAFSTPAAAAPRLLCDAHARARQKWND